MAKVKISELRKRLQTAVEAGYRSKMRDMLQAAASTQTYNYDLSRALDKLRQEAVLVVFGTERGPTPAHKELVETAAGLLLCEIRKLLHTEAFKQKLFQVFWNAYFYRLQDLARKHGESLAQDSYRKFSADLETSALTEDVPIVLNMPAIEGE